MTTRQVLRHFTGRYRFFTRDLLYYFVRQDKIQYTPTPKAKGSVRLFAPSEIEKLEILLKEYASRKQKTELSESANTKFENSTTIPHSLGLPRRGGNSTHCTFSANELIKRLESAEVAGQLFDR